MPQYSCCLGPLACLLLDASFQKPTSTPGPTSIPLSLLPELCPLLGFCSSVLQPWLLPLFSRPLDLVPALMSEAPPLSYAVVVSSDFTGLKAQLYGVSLVNTLQLTQNKRF